MSDLRKQLLSPSERLGKTHPDDLTREQSGITSPALCVAWDPTLISAEDYAKVINAFGNVYRKYGGESLKLIKEVADE